MNNYVTFDTLKYRAPHGAFAPLRDKPATERLTLSGASDVTYGPGVTLEWIGELIGPVTPDDGTWGDIDDLRASLEKRTVLAFIDHYNVAATVYAFGPHGETSFTPMWDGASNEWRVTVRFVVDQGGGVLVPLDTLVLASEIPDISPLGGEVTVSLQTLEMIGSAVDMFVSTPIQMQTLILAGSANMEGIPQVVVMDTLELAGAAPNLTVA